MHTPGTRVVAMRDANETTVFLYGYGVYDGDIEHPEFGFPNPRITLDDGAGVVWGLECWWMPEDQFKDLYIKGRSVEIVGIKH